MKLINKAEFEDLKKNIKIEKVVAGGSVANTMAGIAHLKEIHLLLEKLTLITLEICIEKVFKI
jgi:hypothetical protein